MKNKGFTIVEILVVVVIIGLLLAIAVPSVITIANRMRSNQSSNNETLAMSAAIIWSREHENCFFTSETACQGENCGFECPHDFTCTEFVGNERTCYVTLRALADARLIERDSDGRIIDPSTGEDISDNVVPIVYNRENNSRTALDITRNQTTTTTTTTVPPPPEPILAMASRGGHLATDRFLSTASNAILRNQIESIEIVNHRNVPANAVGSYDVSDRLDGSVTLWYLPGSRAGLFRVFIGGNGKVFANRDSSFLFAHLQNATSIQVRALDTSRVTNMSAMFGSNNNGWGMSRDSFACTLRSASIRSLDLSNFDTSNVTNMSRMFTCLQDLDSLNISTFDTSKVTNMSAMFFGLSSLRNINVTHFNTSRVTNMERMFAGLGVTSLNISNFDMTNITQVSHMFSGTLRLSTIITNAGTNIFNWDTRNVRSFQGMFSMSWLPTIEFGPNFVATNVTNLSSMLSGIESLTRITTPAGVNVINWDTRNVTTMWSFISSTSLRNIEFGPNFVTNNVTDFEGMLSANRVLTQIKTPAGTNVINWDTSRATRISHMLNGTSLSSIEFGPNFVTTNVRDISYLFGNMRNLSTIITPSGTNVINWDTRNVTAVFAMFESTGLTNIEFGSRFVTDNVTTFGSMFRWADRLTRITTPAGVNVINWNANNATDWWGTWAMFEGASRIPNLEFGPNFRVNNVTNMDHMFRGMSSLNSTQGLNIRHFSFTHSASRTTMFNGIPNNARITVNAAGRTWLNTNQRNLTNIVVQ